jgi:hypothetical protein
MVLPDQFQRQAAMFEALATTAARPLKAFSDHQAARNWLDTMSARPAAAQSTKYEELVVSRHTESVGLLALPKARTSPRPTESKAGGR